MYRQYSIRVVQQDSKTHGLGGAKLSTKGLVVCNREKYV